MENLKSYLNKSDWYLIQKSKQGNEAAKTCLIKRYQHIVWYKARRYAYDLNDLDDFVQEGSLALYESIYTFKKEREATYPTFIEICIDRKLTSYIRKQTTKKASLLSKATSIDEPSTLINPLIASIIKPPEYLLLQKSNSLELKKCIFQSLTLQERNVILAYLDGESLKGISIKTNKPYKSIDNAMQRSIRKLKKCLNQ